MQNKEKMFVITENSEGKWEKYDDTWDITIHCKSEAEREKVMRVIQRAAKLIREYYERG